MDIVSGFKFFFGNWQFIGLAMTLYLLLLRAFLPKTYAKFLHSMEFNPSMIILAMAGIFVIVFREVIVIPFNFVVAWLPESWLWEQVIFWVYTTHLVSIAMFSSMIFYFWKKFNSLVPALYVSFLAISIIELTFIPQHFIVFNAFLGSWYFAFVGITLLFLVERKIFRMGSWKKFSVFFCLGIVLEYVIVPFIPYSFTAYSSLVNTWILNQNVLPHPTWITWGYVLLQSLIKIVFILGFMQIDRKSQV